jgi:aspartokinase-like uncharacterized kinase
MRRIIKVGGSLLDLADLPLRLRNWTDSQSPGVNLFVVGGGGIVEAMRELDAIHDFEAAQVHWWCVHLLSTSAALLSSLVPEWPVLRTNLEVQSALGRQVDSNGDWKENFVLDTGKLYTAEAVRQASVHPGEGDAEARAVHLPLDWSTTTDSIAAWLCCRFTADELVLLKSVDVEGCDWDSHAETGLVDAAFPSIVSKVPGIRVINLRSNGEGVR